MEPVLLAGSSLSVNITDAPTVNAGPDQSVCSNEPTAPLNASVTNAAGIAWSTTGAGKFFPSNTDAKALYTPAGRDISSGIVTLLLTTTGNGDCIAVSDSKIINITQAPTVDAGPDRLMLENGIIRLEPVVNGTNLQYEWLPDLFLSNNRIKNPVVTGKTDQLYTLKVTGTGGCVASDETFVKVLKPITVPNIFSPNGDGIQ
jgi:hypothetical protein